MKANNTVLIVVSILLVVFIFLYFNGRHTDNIQVNQIEALKFQRDSIVNSNLLISKQKEEQFKVVADSLIAYGYIYIKADSINKINIYNEKKKLSQLTRAGRDHVRDSLFRANNIQVGSR